MVYCPPEAAEQLDDIVKEFNDRFGALPEEVKNLLYAIKVKALAARAGIEAISTEDGQVIIRLFQGMKLDHGKFLDMLREGIKLGTRRITLNPKRLGKEWKQVLEEVVGAI